MGADRRGFPSTAPGFYGLGARLGDGVGSPPCPPRPRFRCAAPTSNARAVQAASRTSAKPDSIVTLSGAPSALLCKWNPPRPCSAGAALAVSGGPRDRAAPGALSHCCEETDGAEARRRGSEPGESADPAHPAGHPRETPSGAAGELRALGPAGARAPAPTGAAPPAPPAPRVPLRPPATWVPGAVGGRVWGQERDGAGAGKGES